MVTIKWSDLEKGVVKVQFKVGQTQLNLIDCLDTTRLGEINIQILITGGVNRVAVTVSANRERPNLGFESENAWQWWKDRYLGIEINDMRF